MSWTRVCHLKLRGDSEPTHVSSALKAEGVYGLITPLLRFLMEAGAPARRTSTFRYRRIVFTINNWTAQEYADICKWTPTWLVVGKEVGEEGTPHLQGAAILGKQMTMSGLKKIPGMTRAHIEPMMGTPESNFNYCTKQDVAAFSSGKMPEPGKRNDLAECYNDLRNGATMRDLALYHGVSVIKYAKGLTVTRSLLVEPRNEPPKVIWIYGPTGVGKTRVSAEFANENFNGDFWLSAGDLKWFDGYDGQHVAILDDFRGKHCSFPFLLRLLDRYPFRVPFKGGFVEWIPKIIFITCPYSPEDLFEVRGKHLPEDLNQLKRRITKVIYWKDNGFSLTSVKKILTDLIIPKVINLEDSDIDSSGDEGVSLLESLSNK